MQKIYAQKGMFLFINVFTFLFIAIGIFGGSIENLSWPIYLIALFLFLLSLPMLINRIYFDDTHVRFAFIYIKRTVTYEEIAEIFIEDKLITGCDVIFNFEKAIGEDCPNFISYQKKCKTLEIRNTAFVTCMSRKDLRRLLQHYHGKVTVVTNLGV